MGENITSTQNPVAAPPDTIPSPKVITTLTSNIKDQLPGCIVCITGITSYVHEIHPYCTNSSYSSLLSWLHSILLCDCTTVYLNILKLMSLSGFHFFSLYILCNEHPCTCLSIMFYSLQYVLIYFITFIPSYLNFGVLL